MRDSDRPQFVTNWGPLDRPILGRDAPPALGVLISPAEPMPIGIAFPAGLVAHPQGPAVTFRLVIGKEELPDRYLCIGRRFFRLGEAAEEL
jgi:hypothetical protein